MVSFVSGIEQLLQGTTVKIDYELNGSSPVPGTRADNLMGNGHEIQSEKKYCVYGNSPFRKRVQYVPPEVTGSCSLLE